MAVDAAAVIFSTVPFHISGHGTSHKWPSSSPLLFAPGKGCGGWRQESAAVADPSHAPHGRIEKHSSQTAILMN